MDCPAIYLVLAVPLIYAGLRWLFSDKKSSNKEELKDSACEIVLDNIKTRRTISPKDHNGKQVSKKEIVMILEAANWAPNHKKTEPWRYTIFSGPDAIMQYLDYIEDHYDSIKDQLPDEETALFNTKMAGARSNWTSASHLIVIGMKRFPDKVPEWEEICAVAMSVQNMHLMANALDVGGFWSSQTWSRRCRDDPVYKKYVGLDGPEDRVFGAFLIGKVDPEVKAKVKSSRGNIEDKICWKK